MPSSVETLLPSAYPFHRPSREPILRRPFRSCFRCRSRPSLASRTFGALGLARLAVVARARKRRQRKIELRPKSSHDPAWFKPSKPTQTEPIRADLTQTEPTQTNPAYSKPNRPSSNQNALRRLLSIQNKPKFFQIMLEYLLKDYPKAQKILILFPLGNQDYKIHRDEIHAKLVQIMRERMLVHLRGLPQIVESWSRPGDSDAQPSQFARSLTKEVGFLQRVLSRTLHEADVQVIFRQVVIIFHSQISEAFSQLEISTPQAKDRLFRDVKHILGCIRLLPTDEHGKSGIPNWGQLDEFFVQTFGDETA